MSGEPFLYPSVTSLPGQSGAIQGPAEPRQPKKQPGVKGEFDQVLDHVNEQPMPDLGQVKAPLKFSSHASQRLHERKISLDPTTMAKVSDAIDKAQAKGVEETLVLTKDAALIVSVRNRTVITALDRNSLSGNVFTNIDGAVVI